MADQSRGKGRAIIFAMIPIGFVIIVLVMVLGGFFRAEEAREEPVEQVPLEEPETPAESGPTGDAEPDEVQLDDPLTDDAEPQTPDVEVRPSVADTD
ncbi:hypothetical protein [Limimaricola pyoseonensis]|uniref:Uncharacterized protein n=1 Tax=Limimaricola pyoseonensis TaxID=521013 RepID=A0A1G7F7F8_9RHOB|nr:hypothetical protein [Limimaricola pyoseonensis]SDE71756.1 hypothetical protein SAMN04488567_2458 [Limimaricola pyoseonensis]